MIPKNFKIISRRSVEEVLQQVMHITAGNAKDRSPFYERFCNTANIFKVQSLCKGMRLKVILL